MPPGDTATGGQPVADAPSPSPEPTETTVSEPSPEPSPDVPEEPRLSDEELAELGVNELGRVLVMEWHEIGDRDARWANSAETFRAQIQELYDRGYRPVTTEEFIEGSFPIPAGTSPVLLTFDDSYKSHMHFGDDGEPDPDSVVGILEEFSRENPDWRATAVFYIYWPVPFREADEIDAKLRWLVENGYEIGNHTLTHVNLAEVDDTEVQRQLALAQAEVEERVPGYRLRSFALTFGIWPENEELALRGSYEGQSYAHDLVMLVGFMPTRSPHHVEYDPARVQRVQAYVPEFRQWVDWLDAEPNRRFVSDGDPTMVTFPESFADVAAPLEGFDVRTYPAPDQD
jgi:peptidoglycan/xylan/chitin deacetylase (PgdA/CDA1 family)